MAMLTTAATVVAISPRSAEAQESQSDNRAGGLEEITVTARRREESVQDVPITVTAFSPERFEREQMAGLRDLNLSAPNLNIVNNTGTSNSAQVFIRGIGRDDSTWNVESGVAIYVDGVYLPQQNGALLDLLDFKRVEVLNGPQGTLYGRNATGGAIKFVTRKPDPSGFRGIAEIEVGSYDKLDFRGTVNVPLADNWAMKADIVSRDEEGFITNRPDGRKLNGTDRQTARLSVRHTGDWDVTFSIDRQVDRSGLQSPTPIRFDAAAPGGGGTITPLDANGLQVPAYGEFVSNTSVRDLNRYNGTGYALLAVTDTRWGQVTSTTSFREFNWDVSIDLDGNTNIRTDLIQRVEDEAFSQELQLASGKESGLNYVVGLYYYSDKITFGADNVFIGRRNDSKQKTQSYAVYGELTYDFNDTFQVFAGGRYSEDKKEIVQAGSALGTGLTPFSVSIDDSWDNFSPRAGINVRWTPDILTYVTYSKGFKAGGAINGRPGTATDARATYDPEEVEALEAGIKSSWFDRTLIANLGVFDLDYSNIAFTFLDPATNALAVAPADFKIRGIEYSLHWLPIEALRLSVTGGVVDGEITKIPRNPVTNAILGGFTPQSKLKHVAPNHLKVGAEYTLDLAGDSELVFGANVSHNGLIYRNTANSFQGATPSTTLVDARIAYRFGEEGRYSMTLAGQNLSDESYWLQSLSTFARWYAKPRTWSLTFRTNF
jgi:iron complex outermembrane receptor protein